MGSRFNENRYSMEKIRGNESGITCVAPVDIISGVINHFGCDL